MSVVAVASRAHLSLVDGPGGYSIYPWVGRCGSAPHTLTLFKTKIADFPTLFQSATQPLLVGGALRDEL